MLPSMPILFTRESQDAFGNKIQPSTSLFSNKYVDNTVISQIQPAQNIPVKKQEPQQTNDSIETDGKGTKRKGTSEDEEPQENDRISYENALVSTYYRKVRSRFGTSTAGKNKFKEFQETLKNFDPHVDTPVDLYKNIETLLGEENKDLAEEFLLFLTPGQAAEVGRFMDHLMLTKMSKFLKLLRSTFYRKPTMLRKIMRAVTNSMNCDSVKEMRSKVLPHLRSSPRLTLMYKSLFPDEVPPDSVYEGHTDTLTDSLLNDDNGCDVWVYEEPAENRRNFFIKEGLDTKYLQDRVFLQYGKILKSSKVTYPYSKEPYRVHARRLAPDHCRISPPQSDEEKSSPRKNTSTTKPQKNIRKRSKKAPKSPCVRNLMKDVNDNTKHNLASETKSGHSTESPKSSKARHHNQSHDKNKAQESKSTEVTEKKEGRNSRVTKDKDLKPTERQNKRDNKRKDKTEGNKKNAVESKNDETPRAKRVKVEIIKPKERQMKVKNSWTEDEDKIVLQIMQGEARTQGNEQNALHSRKDETAKVKKAKVELNKAKEVKQEIKVEDSCTVDEDKKTMLQISQGEVKIESNEHNAVESTKKDDTAKVKKANLELNKEIEVKPEIKVEGSLTGDEDKAILQGVKIESDEHNAVDSKESKTAKVKKSKVEMNKVQEVKREIKVEHSSMGDEGKTMLQISQVDVKTKSNEQSTVDSAKKSETAKVKKLKLEMNKRKGVKRDIKVEDSSTEVQEKTMLQKMQGEAKVVSNKQNAVVSKKVEDSKVKKVKVELNKAKEVKREIKVENSLTRDEGKTMLQALQEEAKIERRKQNSVEPNKDETAEAKKAKVEMDTRKEIKREIDTRARHEDKTTLQALQEEAKTESSNIAVEPKKDETAKAKKAKVEINKQKEVKRDLKVENSWTRDEDKTMLQILQGEGRSDQIFCRIRELLPHRSMSDIKERYSHVMNLLQQMALGEVT